MLKKFFVFSLFSLLLCVCGCSDSVKAEPILNKISFTAEIEYGSNKYVCDTSIVENVLNLTVIKPDEIKGLNLIISQNGAEAEFKGVRYTTDSDTLPDDSVANIIYNLIIDVSNNKTASYNDENCEITGKMQGKKYSFIFSPSGLPISLCIDELDLKIEFKDVSLI